MRTAPLDESLLKAMIKAGDTGGVPVRYWPVWLAEDQDSFKDTKTRSEPWMLGHGEWVVKVEGMAGGVAVSHCRLLDAAVLPGANMGPKFEGTR